jgi:ribonuclease T
MSQRFRGFLPVVVDVETAGFNAETDALLEIAAVVIGMDDNGRVYPGKTFAAHVLPFEGANLDEAALAFNGIDPYHPFRMALPERQALENIFGPVSDAVTRAGCTRAILVGHNAFFDLGFLNAAVRRSCIRKNPFHSFSSLDTATLGALAYGQTVLARVAEAADIEWDSDAAHSAIYDAERTAEVFCAIVNHWDRINNAGT